jgi:hypothetical protein
MRSTSSAWKTYWPSTKSRSLARNLWSVWTKSRWCCTPMFARHAPCGRDEFCGAIKTGLGLEADNEPQPGHHQLEVHPQKTLQKFVYNRDTFMRSKTLSASSATPSLICVAPGISSVVIRWNRAPMLSEVFIEIFVQPFLADGGHAVFQRCVYRTRFRLLVPS